MKKCNIYLKDLKDLYTNFQSLKDLPFIEFSRESLILLGKIKNDIDISYVNKKTEVFIKYSNTIKAKLEELDYDSNKGLIIEITKWYLAYNYDYKWEDYRMESILNIDQEYDIYTDLSYPINRLRGDLTSDRIFNLQNDFLAFSKVGIVKDILKHLDKKNILFKDVEDSTKDLVSEIDHKTKELVSEITNKTKESISKIDNIKKKWKRAVEDKKSEVNKRAWFEVGLLFATGAMDILKREFQSNATQIAKYKFGVKWEKYRPYISESIGNTTKNNKNIFSDKSKLKLIYDHCIKNKIPMIKSFEDHITNIQSL